MRGNVQYWVFISIASLAAACASSGAGSECDQANPCDDGFACVGGACVAQPDAGDIDAPSNPFVDAGDVVDAGPMFDAAPEAGFGEPCSDKGDCESNICIFVNIGGICTETCVAGSCDTGFGCFGVFGAIDPGEVADVCVPESNQLCSPCQEHTECSIIGQDKCVPSDNGKQFCARDCSVVACPGGYTCQTVNVDGADTQQCIANSGACDCNAALAGNTESCDLTTPFGTCQGVRTCQGAAGWGSCEPPSATDPLDGTFIDDNCDGIDGEYDRGIFVSRDSGTDASGCGLTHTAPCASIGQGLIESIVSGRSFIYVQASALDYSEIVSLVVGKHIYGGYDAGWVRDTHTDAAHRVSIIGGLDAAEDQYMTIKAHGLIAPTTLADVLITGPTAVGTTASGTRGSYAVHVDNANLNLERVTIVAGNGANGSAGGNGFPRSSAAATSGMRGGTGGGARQLSAGSCNDSSRGSKGAGGTNSCSGGGVGPNGGAGGNGGTADKKCRFGICTSCDAQPGAAGSGASWNSASFGNPGGGGGGTTTCGQGGDAGGGRTFNGGAGSAGSGGGFVNSGYWYARAGGAGGIGDHGSGGGGGGGSGGCDTGIDSYGAGGGGGGAGGCRATSGGSGGIGGGGSFGVFAVNGSTVTANSCTIQRGIAGDGGGGGAGGHGQRGGARGTAGAAGDDSKRGGFGGAGGHGGHGGGGAGGSGGIAAGIYYNSSTISQTCTISGGSRGDGGSGGASAPNAPVGERDGNNGASGALGSLFTVRECANPAGC